MTIDSNIIYRVNNDNKVNVFNANLMGFLNPNRIIIETVDNE